jgi:hypothetical protein
LTKTTGKLPDLAELICQNYFETLLPCIGLLQKLDIMIVDVNMLEVLPPVYWKPEEINRLWYLPLIIKDAMHSGSDKFW